MKIRKSSCPVVDRLSPDSLRITTPLQISKKGRAGNCVPLNQFPSSAPSVKSASHFGATILAFPSLCIRGRGSASRQLLAAKGAREEPEGIPQKIQRRLFFF